MHLFPKREPLQELGNEIFKLVSYSATPEQWAEWLRVPLEHAVARGNLDLVNALLQAGADGSAGWRGCRGRTLLDAAAVGGNPDVLTALLGAGAEPDVNVVSMSPKRSALYAATVCGHEEVATRLILAGADVRFEDPVDQCTVLHEAAYGGHVLLVSDLLVGGADPNSDFGPRGSTPLHQAALSGQAEIFFALFLRGGNKDALDQIGHTPLMWAAPYGQLASVETLLSAGAASNIRCISGYSALDLAACRGHINVVKVILRHGADVNSRNDNGLSALHHATMNNQAGAIDTLVEAGAVVDLKSNRGHTPLFQAAYFSNDKPMLTLLTRGAAVMIRSDDGETPLHRACFGKYPGLEVAVDLLLRWGADETAVVEDGRTPADLLDLAPIGGERQCSQGEVERARRLLSRGAVYRDWRRRGWLVMIRSRASASGIYRHGGGDDGPVINLIASEASDRSGESEDHTEPRTEGSRDVPYGGDEVDGERESWDLKGLVAQLLALELEGVFRTVVVFI